MQDIDIQVKHLRKNLTIFESEKKLHIPPHAFQKYNADPCLKVTFSDKKGVKNLVERYKEIGDLPGFLHNFFKGRQSPDRDLIIQNEKLCHWACNYRFMIIPGGANNVAQALANDHLNLKNSLDGFSLVGWVIDPRIFERYGWNPNSETFKNFLIINDHTQETPSTYAYFKRTPSQKKIREVEQSNPDVPYLATILDLTAKEIPFLKELKEASLKHIQDCYGVDLEKDRIEMYFHFPYGEPTTGLHLHIRINQGRHPLEKTRSFSLDKIINFLETGKPICDLILSKNLFYLENTQPALSMLDRVDGIEVERVGNPFPLSSPFINLKDETDISTSNLDNELSLEFIW